MKYINANEALEIIKGMGVACVMEVDSLNYLIEEDEEVECWVNDDVLVIINPSEDTEYVTVVPITQSFNIDEYLELIREKCNNPSMLINMHKLFPEFSWRLNEVLSTEFEYSRTLTDYIYVSKDLPEKPADVRLLTSSDKDIFTSCSNEQIENRPPLPVLFDRFVNRHQGQILAAFEEDKVVGYLALYPISDTVYDVDYIYVVPEKRRLGIGRKLAVAYVLYAMENKHDAYWSNAKTEASSKTAIGSGFEKIRVVNKYILL